MFNEVLNVGWNINDSCLLRWDPIAFSLIFLVQFIHHSFVPKQRTILDEGLKSFFLLIVRKWNGVLRANSRNFQSLHQATRKEDSLRKFQLGWLRHRFHRISRLLESFLLLPVPWFGDYVDDSGGSFGWLLHAKHRQKEHLQSGWCCAGYCW